MASSDLTYPFINLRAMFYVVTPNETSYEKLEDVPNFVDQTVPYFISFIIVECILRKFQGKPLPRMNDGVNSMTHGLLSTMHSLLFRSVELGIYCWIYENYCILSLPWNSGWTWLAAMLLVDFLYYWFHRFSHESNIIWASHQVHHSSEEYNFTTALRQSAWQRYYSMVLYFPMALFFPPAVFHTHVQFNLLYQFWIHTEVIKTIGPLEYILNTPSHHRVHHGRNPYCIDKNYAGTLIIWDRIFNTFQAEEEKVIYGLVHPSQFWNPLKGQMFHYLYIFGLVKSHKGLANKVSAVVKGPGWEPGKPWKGLKSDLPEVEEPVQKYDSSLPTWANVYVGFHFFLIIIAYGAISPHKASLTALTGLACVAFFITSLTSFGALYDHRKFSSLLEFARCLTFLAAAIYVKGNLLFEDLAFTGLVVFFLFSTVTWGVLTCLQYQFHLSTKKIE